MSAPLFTPAPPATFMTVRVSDADPIRITKRTYVLAHVKGYRGDTAWVSWSGVGGALARPDGEVVAYWRRTTVKIGRRVGPRLHVMLCMELPETLVQALPGRAVHEVIDAPEDIAGRVIVFARLQDGGVWMVLEDEA